MGSKKKIGADITPKMIAAGVRIYSAPGRYESYDDVVRRIFIAMRAAEKITASKVKLTE